MVLEILLNLKVLKENKPERGDDEKQVGGWNTPSEIEQNSGWAWISKNLGKIPDSANHSDQEQEKCKDGDYHPWQK